MRQDIAVLGMKCFGSAVILKSGVVEPLDCLHYSLNVPVSVQITGINSQMLLEQAFTAVKTFQPMDEAGVAALIAKSEQAAMNGKVRIVQDDFAL